MVKFKTTNGLPIIEQVTIERQTSKSIWVNGIKRPIVSDIVCYHSNYDDAVTQIKADCRRAMVIAEREFNEAKRLNDIAEQF